jgi:hypothetical protein
MTVSVVSITDVPPATWNEDDLASLKAEYPELRGTLNEAVSKYNPTPGRRIQNNLCLVNTPLKQ